MNLEFFQYNNYYNRIAKRLNAIEDYHANGTFVGSISDMNFNPNDGVNATAVFNNALDATPDYAIVVQDGEIVSRWFVIEYVRTRKGQYQVQLRRDVVADHWNDILDCDAFVERGIIEDTENDLIFNSENVAVSQIKQGEDLLKDKSGCQWIVGYYQKDTQLTGKARIKSTLLNETTDLNVPIEEWEYFKYCTFDPTKPTQSRIHPIGSYYSFSTNALVKTTLSGEYVGFSLGGNLHTSGTKTIYSSNERTYTNPTAQDLGRHTYLKVDNITSPSVIKGYLMSVLDSATTTAIALKCKAAFPKINDPDTVYLKSLENKLIKDVNNKVYKIVLVRVENPDTITKTVGWGEAEQAINSAIVQTGVILNTAKPLLNRMSVTAVSYGYYVYLAPIEDTIVDYNIPLNSEGQEDNKAITVDAPYDIFAIPYGEITFNGKKGGVATTVKTKDVVAIDLAMQLATKYNSSGKLYDIQLLPYCPFADIWGDTEGEYSNEGEINYSWITSDGDPVGVIFNVGTSKITFDIAAPEGKFDINDVKMDSMTKFVRLCSPNYDGVFEFCPAKNGGVTKFNVDLNYKPFAPYIHVNPDFGRLYGNDFDDARGLIVGGDFGLPTLTDAWLQYESQNKNYRDIFERGIQNMEVTYQNDKGKNIASGITSAITSGLAVGAISGNAGLGLAAGVASGIGLAVEGRFNENQFKENKSFATDQFEMQIDNIKALPATLNRVSPFNNNNKGFVFIEYYDCSPTEKDSIAKKIVYNSMNIGTFGKLRDYVYKTWSATVNDTVYTSKGFFKARLVRLPQINDEFHMAATIASEINQGIFMR